jgi:hypothetical protein
MTTAEIDRYLARLGAELRKRGLAEVRIVEEARDHLIDAADQGTRRGLRPAEAEREAIARFGSPQSVAATFAAERYKRFDQSLLAAGVLAGLAIAYVDSRPNWDDTGITALALAASGGVLGLIAPRRPWLWALAVGIWIPLHVVARSLRPGSLGMLIVLAFPFAAACAGMAVRRAYAMRPSPAAGGFHDRPSRFHFAVKSKRGWVNPELAAVVADPTTQLVPFLERVAPIPLGPLGNVQSIRLIDEGSSAKRPKTYQVVFGEHASITCTVELERTGTGISIHWSQDSSL